MTSTRVHPLAMLVPEEISALSNGDVHFALAVPTTFVAPVQAGKIRPLFATRPFSLMRNVPVAADVGIADFSVATNQGIWAPRGTPREIAQRLSAAIAAAGIHRVINPPPHLAGRQPALHRLLSQSP